MFQSLSIWVRELAGSKHMHNEKQKGWVYVLIQFIIILLILGLCFRDLGNIGDKNSVGSIAGLAISIAGFVLMVVTLISFRQIMTPNPVPLDNSILTTTGIYKYVRHPMYSSVLFSLLGVVIYFKSISGFTVWIIGVIFIIYKIRFEEHNLIKRFPDYTAYSNKSKKLIPFIY